MKKLILVLAIVFLTASTACAITLTWDQHTDTSVQGYLLQWEETDNPPETFSIKIVGIENVQQEIADNLFKPNINYSIWVLAYNGIGESGKSNVLQFIRNAYTPPEDNVPTETYEAPGSVVNFINQ